MTTDELVRAATVAAAAVEIAPDPEPKELKHVTPALLGHLERLGADHDSEVTISVPGWLPSPGRTDITIGTHEPYAAVIEVKVYELGWCLSDMVKVASLVDGAKAAAGYLVVAATKTKFAQAGGFGAMLEDHPVINTDRLFTTYGKDWLDLLRGGPGRPLTVPGRIETRVLAREDFLHAPKWEIRAVRVIADRAEAVRFASESWPIGTHASAGRGARWTADATRHPSLRPSPPACRHACARRRRD